MSRKAVVFAYHDVGCMGIRELKKLGVGIGAVYTHEDDPGANHWFGPVKKDRRYRCRPNRTCKARSLRLCS